MTQEAQEKFIDIEAVIHSKNPTLLRWMPKFVLKYIKKIIHQDDINDFIYRERDKRAHAFVNEIVKEFGADISFEGLENIPELGGCIIAANHPIGGLDSIALMQTVARKRKDIKFIVNDVLLNIKNFGNLFIGVNKHGKNSTDVLDLIDSYYSSDVAILIFPAGLVSRKQENGAIRDLAWKKSFITKAKKHQRPIIPVHIAGKNTKFFYNLAWWRGKLGIKLNIEMFYLMDEMYNQEGKKIHVTIGKPIPYQLLTQKHNDQEWAQKIKSHIYNLAEGKDEFEA